MHSTGYGKITNMCPQLLVTDMERSIEFYTKQLGFKIDFRYEDFYAGIIKDGYSIHLKVNEHPTKEHENRRNHQDLEIVFYVDGIEDLYEHLSHKSVAFSQPLRNMPYGREFYVADPDNNIIAFMEV